MQSATDVGMNLGWTVQIYNAAEALPNLVNPFFMLPLLAVLGLRARDLVGFTFLQFSSTAGGAAPALAARMTFEFVRRSRPDRLAGSSGPCRSRHVEELRRYDARTAPTRPYRRSSSGPRLVPARPGLSALDPTPTGGSRDHGPRSRGSSP